MKSNIILPKNRISLFCKKHHIEKMSLFGSVLRDDFDTQSDVDFLVKFKDGYSPSFFKLFAMEEELGEILGGRKADIRTLEDLSKHFRDDVERDSVIQYAS